MADQSNSASAANLISPTEPEETPAVSFQSIFGAINHFLVSHSNNSDHSHSTYSYSRRDQENAPQLSVSVR